MLIIGAVTVKESDAGTTVTHPRGAHGIAGPPSAVRAWFCGAYVDSDCRVCRLWCGLCASRDDMKAAPRAGFGCIAALLAVITISSAIARPRFHDHERKSCV